MSATCQSVLRTWLTASANSFSPHADNSAHSFFFDDDLSAAQKSGIDWARKNSLSPTDMTTSVNASYNNKVDVWVYSTWNPPADLRNAYAWAKCIKRVNASKCDQHELVVNNRVPHSNYKSRWTSITTRTGCLRTCRPPTNCGWRRSAQPAAFLEPPSTRTWPTRFM